MKEFKAKELKKLFKPQRESTKEDNGQVTIIGGSKLFHGAPLFALKTAARVVDMVFFASPEPSLRKIAENLKSQLSSFIWVPWEEVREYIKKSDAILIGPGLMRYHQEGGKTFDGAGKKSKEITEGLLSQFSDKQWVIDAGSLQVMEAKFIPQNAILTPNKREFRMLFGGMKPEEAARKYECIIIDKGPEELVYSPQEKISIKGGNPGLTKGGTGDVLAGLALALVAKNPPLLAACAASYLVKKAADRLQQTVGLAYNADDLANKIPEVLGTYFR